MIRFFVAISFPMLFLQHLGLLIGYLNSSFAPVMYLALPNLWLSYLAFVLGMFLGFPQKISFKSLLRSKYFRDLVRYDRLNNTILFTSSLACFFYNLFNSSAFFQVARDTLVTSGDGYVQIAFGLVIYSSSSIRICNCFFLSNRTYFINSIFLILFASLSQSSGRTFLVFLFVASVASSLYRILLTWRLPNFFAWSRVKNFFLLITAFFAMTVGISVVARRVESIFELDILRHLQNYFLYFVKPFGLYHHFNALSCNNILADTVMAYGSRFVDYFIRCPSVYQLMSLNSPAIVFADGSVKLGNVLYPMQAAFQDQLFALMFFYIILGICFSILCGYCSNFISFMFLPLLLMFSIQFFWLIPFSIPGFIFLAAYLCLIKIIHPLVKVTPLRFLL